MPIKVFFIHITHKDAKIILGKIHVPFTKTGVISLTPYAYSSKNYIYEKVEVPIPDKVIKSMIGDNLSRSYPRTITDGTKAYMVWYSYGDEKKEGQRLAIRITEITTDLRVSFKSVEISNDLQVLSNSPWCAIKDDVIYIVKRKQEGSQQNCYLCGIDINTGTVTSSVKLPSLNSWTLGNYMNKILLYDEINVYFYDTVLKKLLTINASNVNFLRNCVKGANHLITDDNRFYTAPVYLATINNLSEPITKTPELVMKITYTLTTELES